MRVCFQRMGGLSVLAFMLIIFHLCIKKGLMRRNEKRRRRGKGEMVAVGCKEKDSGLLMRIWFGPLLLFGCTLSGSGTG